MGDLFIWQFQSSMAYAHPVATLANIKQRSGETLHDYFKRFNTEVPYVRGATDEAVKNFLIAGLRRGSDFWKNIQAHEPATLQDFYRQAEPFKIVEKSMAELDQGSPPIRDSYWYRNRKRGRSVTPDRKRRSPSPKKERLKKEKTPPKSTSGTQGRGQNKFTPLVASIDHIYAINADKGIIGGQYIGGDSRKTRDRYAREAKSPPLTNVHHLSQRPPKMFKGESRDIMFAEEDAKWVHHPHTDALVVKIKIGSTNVHRVLVDNGSAANILSYDAYIKMGFLDKDMSTTLSVLYDFSGAPIDVKGSIRLPVTLGEGPLSTTQIAEWLIVNQYSAFNAVVDHPILRDMRIVTSIYHLSMKFPTPGGVGCVKGCQYDSRDCYNRAVRIAERGNLPETLESMEMDKKVKGGGLGFTCNMISIEELLEDYFENLGIQVEPRPGALTMGPSLPVMTMIERDCRGGK